MTIDVDAREGLLAAAAERPVLVTATALSIFACLLVASTFFGATQSTTATIEVTRIELDSEASEPARLIKTAPIAFDTERDAILSGRLLKDALAKVSLGADIANDLATISPLQRIVASFSSPSGNDQRMVDKVLALNAVHKNLRVDPGVEDDRLDISLSSSDHGSTDDVTKVVNAIAAAYVDLRNQERKRQKAAALSWADEKLANWQAAVDGSRTPVVGDQPSLDTAAATEGKQLLDLLIEATKAAQASTLTEMRYVLSVKGLPSQQRYVDVLEKDYAALQLDLQKLSVVSFENHQTPGQIQPASLDFASPKEGLVSFRKDLDALISSGFLDSPAATIISPARTTSLRPFSYWAVVLPLAIAVSILLALILATIIGRRQEDENDTGDEASVAFNTNIESVLSNPHWPMTPEQHRQNQAPPIQLG